LKSRGCLLARRRYTNSSVSGSRCKALTSLRAQRRGERAGHLQLLHRSTPPPERARTAGRACCRPEFGQKRASSCLQKLSYSIRLINLHLSRVSGRTDGAIMVCATKLGSKMTVFANYLDVGATLYQVQDRSSVKEGVPAPQPDVRARGPRHVLRKLTCCM